MDLNTFVVVGTQWGDEGKGKIIDVLAPKADMVVRFQGGNNAGHTVIVGDEKFVLHLLPSGAVSGGGICLIGAGVAIDIEVLLEEIKQIEQRGKSMDQLYIDERAHVIMPYHIAVDKAREESLGSNKIGTTLRGIGPAYVDKVTRNGIRIGDLLNAERLKDKIEWNVKEKNDLLFRYGKELFDAQELFEKYQFLAQKIEHRIVDGVERLNTAVKNRKTVLFEGAQAMMLDIDHGTYPYVTSSSPTAGGACSGAGIAPNKLSHIIGVMKAYTTRVGEGPFACELIDETGEMLRRVGHEFGATTGRPRRCGWLDLVVGTQAVLINGLTDIVLTKLDVLTGLETIKVAVAYHIDGKRYKTYPSHLTKSTKVDVEYVELEGWSEDITSVRTFEKLPRSAQKYIEFIEMHLGVCVSMISVGPERTQNIYRTPLLQSFGGI
ncbi:MAG: adenylosuccinate synthase [Culicoidibacterales bacterium]